MLWKNINEKMKTAITEHAFAFVFIIFMTFIYIHMMFTNKPWYDELYTYYYFISRGPIYAAIHWPVPNNHVGYSVLSAFFDLFGNSYIGLRGVSLIGAVANLILIYRFCLKQLGKELSFVVMALYAAAYLVHRLSVQGRGYTLACSCFIVAITACRKICLGIHEKRDYCTFAAALTLGLYIVPSSIYFVMPVCVTGGIYLLVSKEYKTLLKLFISGVCAAIATCFLYTLIWLAIGANLVSKDSESVYFGLNQAKIVLKAPFLALKTGIEYMTATPYIQSIDRRSCIIGLPQYFKELFDNFYDKMGVCVVIITLICLAFNIILVIKDRKNAGAEFFGSLFVAVTLVFVPLMLIIQSVHPYKRVLTFMVFPMVLSFCIVLKKIIGFIKYERAGEFALIISASVLIINVFNPYYRAPLADRENELEALFAKIDNKQIDSIYYTDDFQKYVLKFYHGVTPIECYTLEEANYVVIGPEERDESYDSPVWPVLYPYSDGLLQDIDEKMVELESVGNYTIYAKK